MNTRHRIGQLQQLARTLRDERLRDDLADVKYRPLKTLDIDHMLEHANEVAAAITDLDNIQLPYMESKLLQYRALMKLSDDMLAAGAPEPLVQLTKEHALACFDDVLNRIRHLHRWTEEQ